MVSRWGRQEEYSHAYLIPLVSLYILWQLREKIQSVRFNPSWITLIFIIIGLLIAIIGEITAIYILIQLSVILIIAAMVWSLTGTKALKFFIFPVFLLVFTIPLPYFIEAKLTSNLQLLSSEIGVGFIRLFNIPVYLEGNIIDLGEYQLQVVEACSGLRYMYPLLSISMIVAYITKGVLWKKVILVLSSIPITILMNSIRIGVIGVLVDQRGIEMAEGFLHYFEGWIIFMICMAILLAELWVLNRVFKEKNSLATESGHDFVDNISESTPSIVQRKIGAPFFVAIGMMVIALILIQSVDTRNEILPERTSFVLFPETVKSWKGVQKNLKPIVVEKLSLTDYLINDYRRSSGDLPVNIYIAYYQSQRKGISPHSPQVCIPGGGWSITNINRSTLELDEALIPVNEIIIQNGDQKQLVYYWFRQRGHDMSSEYELKWRLLVDSLSLNRTDGALIRLVTPIAKGGVDQAKARLNQFISDINSELSPFIPGR